ncbi:DnaJ domain-containing protein [Nocardioides sp. CCNWLW239]|uniref:DnaJ domain-containing protein n=1 Tax=Nocardioides sp. CCNWLW239 TaxID=3128902 RepID=UPI00301AC5C5
MSGKFIDAYAVLEIGPDADDAAVRARHRELAKQFHPDRGGRAADGELMMRINRARDVLLDPVARATLDEELARRRREATPPETRNAPGASAPGSPPLSRDRRWRAEWGTASPWTTPPPGSSSPGSVPPPPARVRPSANRLRQATRQATRQANRQAARQARAANPALSSRQQPPVAPAPSPAAETPRAHASNPQAVNPQAPHPPSATSQQAAPGAEKPTNAWSLYSVPLDGVSVASLLASVLMCSPLGFVLGIIGLARTADDKRRGRWAAVAGIAISTLTMLVAIGYVMQAMSAPTP